MGLAATGYSMQLYRDSRPASGAEHLMSHIWEMENLTFNGDSVSHGFKVSVGTVASTALYEALFSLTEKEARRHAEPGLPRAAREAEIDALLIRGCYGAAAKEIALSKFLEGEKLAGPPGPRRVPRGAEPLSRRFTDGQTCRAPLLFSASFLRPPACKCPNARYFYFNQPSITGMLS